VRWCVRSLAAVASLATVVLVSALVLLHSLDRPWIKARLLARVRSAAGVDVRYRAVHVHLLDGIDIDGITVESPAAVRALAADLVSIGRLEVRWSLRSLVGYRADQARIERVTVRDVALVVVVDEHGRTSFDALPPRPPSRSAPVPLSGMATNLLRAPLPVALVEIDGLALALVRTEDGSLSERTDARGISGTITKMPAATEEGSEVRALFGGAADVLDLGVTHARGSATATAHAKVSLAVTLTSTALTGALDLRVPEQTFAPSVSADRWLHADVTARFEAKSARTVVTVERAEAGDGSVKGSAVIEIPDEGDSIVRHAVGDVDLARLLSWVPAGIAPVTAEHAQLHAQIDSLVAAELPHLSDQGSFVLDADLANVGVDVPGGPLRLESSKVSLHVQPHGKGLVARGTITLDAAHYASSKGPIAGDTVELELEATRASDGAVDGRAALRFGKLAVGGASSVVVRGGHVELRVKGILADLTHALATRGDVHVTGEFASLDAGARSDGTSVTAEGLTLSGHAGLDGRAPYRVEGSASVSRLRVFGIDRRPLLDTPARLDATVQNVEVDLSDLASSNGNVRATVDLGESTVSLDATKGGDTVDFDLHARAPKLSILRPLLSPAVARAAPWDEIALALRSVGHVDHLRGGPAEVQQTTELTIERPMIRDMRARSLALTLQSAGTSVQQDVTADIRANALSLAGEVPSDDHATVSASLDRKRRSLRVTLGVEGRAAIHVAALLAFDGTSHAITYEVEGHAAKLGRLAPLTTALPELAALEAFDLADLDVALSSHGALLGVVAGVGDNWGVELQPHPTMTAAIDGNIDLGVAGLRWTHGDTLLATRSATWHAALRTDGSRRHVDSHLEVDTLHLGLDAKSMDFSGVRDDTSAVVTGDLADPGTELTQRASIRGVEQDLVPGYPIGDVTLAVTADRDHDGVIHLSDLKLVNGAGGTTLELAGNLELTGVRRMLSVTGAVGQDLARLSRTPERFKGRGQLALDASVTSPDLSVFRVRAAMKMKDVFLDVPRADIAVEAATGEVPISVALEIGKGGVALRPDERRSAYSMLRFADQHPLLSHGGFLSVASVKTPYVTVAPLVGNLAIEQNVISLRQFEVGVRHGTITGQCALEWDGPHSSAELHVRATGVQSSHGEPFDGNIAVLVSAADRTIEGRADVLRIGQRHLLDLLDLADPLHADRGMNRIRTAMTIGYPDRLHLAFDHGFASVRLELGGAARLISIGELRGIPMGPIVDNLLGAAPDAKAPR